MRKDMIKVGVVGLGKIAQTKYIPALHKNPNCILTAICDRSRELLRMIGNDYGLNMENCYIDIKQFLQADMDIVFILTHNHEKLIEAVIAHNKHVFVEKPICWDYESAQKMFKLAKEKNLMLYPGYMKLFDPSYVFFKKYVDEHSDSPICVRVNCYAGNVKKWSDSLYRIHKELSSEKVVIKSKLQNDWEQWFKKKGLTQTKQKALAQSILQLGIHSLNLLQDLMKKPVQIKNCYFDEGRSQFFHANLEIGEMVPCEYVLIPCFHAPWKWKESYEIVYMDKIVQLNFENPFLPNSNSKVVVECIQDEEYVKQEYEFNQYDAFYLQIDDCIKQLLFLNWSYKNMELALNDLDLVEKILKRVEFYEK